MKRIYYYIPCVIIALLAISCESFKDDRLPEGPLVIPEKLSAHLPAFDTKTRSFQGAGLVEDAPESWDDTEEVMTRTYAVINSETIDPTTGEAREYYYQYWSEGDAISLFFTMANLKYVMQYYKYGTLDIGEFQLEGNKTEGPAIRTNYFYSVYPYKENTRINIMTGLISYEFPQIQHYSGDTYANGENGMIAIEPKDGTDYVLYFQNFCSYLQLRLVAIDGQPTCVKKITLTSNNSNDLISGPGSIEVINEDSVPVVEMGTEPVVEMMMAASNQITLDCGSGVELSTDENAPTKFWFVVPGNISFSSGFSISVIYDDNYYYRKSTPKPIGIERSHIKPMATIKPEAVKANGPIRYKYNDLSNTDPFPVKNTFYGENGVVLDILDQIYDEETKEWVILLSGTLKAIGDNSFEGPGHDIEYIKVMNEDEPVAINNFAFYNCTADSLLIYNPVGQIKANAFKNSTITDIMVDGNVNSIQTGVSSDSHIESLTIKGNLGTIEEDAFHGLESLVSVNIGGSVDVIHQSAFDSCDNLEIVEIGGDIDIIEAKAFNNNDKLHTIDFTGAIEKIGDYAFNDCDALETFHVDGGVGEIGKEAFAGCDILNFVSIEGNVGTIGERAFYDSDEIVFVDIHGNIGTIGDEAFSKMDELQKVHITGNVTTIGSKAFKDSDALSELLIDGQVDVIKQEAFASCDALETVNLNGKVKSIEEKAFYDCDNLNTVMITGNVDVIREKAFANCDALQSFSVNSVETIGFEAFLDCKNLTEINVPGVKYIDKAAFQNCFAIVSMNLDSVISIDDSAFWGCTGLTIVEISENCTMIGEGAFCNASNLQKVYCYAVNPPFIKTDNDKSSYVFSGTHQYLLIFIPKDSYYTYINKNYFQNNTYDDPAIKAKVNWWYQEYQNILVEL